MRRSRWYGVAAVSLMVGLAPIPLADATPLVTSRRLEGPDRYATAAAIALANGEPSAVATLARGDDPADALAGSTLTGIMGGPILLTTRDRLSPVALEALQKLGANQVYLLGGSAAISDDVARELQTKGFDVRRLAGRDRFDTARIIVGECTFECGYSEIGGKRVTLLANGFSPADAAAAGAIASGARVPLLLTERDRLPAATLEGLAGARAEQVLIVGGEAVVSAAVVAELQDNGYEVRRIGGANRQATAVLLAQVEQQELGWVIDHVNLTRGDVLADALAGGPHAGQEQAPVLLTESPNSLGPAARAFLEANAVTIHDLDVFGDGDAVSAAVVDDAERAAGRG